MLEFQFPFLQMPLCSHQARPNLRLHYFQEPLVPYIVCTNIDVSGETAPKASLRTLFTSVDSNERDCDSKIKKINFHEIYSRFSKQDCRYLNFLKISQHLIVDNLD